MITLKKTGFTLVELLVTISIIGILASIVYANYGPARASARDEVRKNSLMEVKLALELYKAQYGRYPAGCNTAPGAWSGLGPGSTRWSGSCNKSNYINGLVPDFIAELPWDPKTNPGPDADNEQGYIYRASPDGKDYKFLAFRSVESQRITSYEDEFARCDGPKSGDSICLNPFPSAKAGVVKTYAVYSKGAVAW